MLILTRAPQEKIHIVIDNKSVGTVAYLGMRGREARLGFEGPETTRFVREEVLRETVQRN